MDSPEYLHAALEVKAVQATQRIISGFAAGIGNTDRVQDVIAPGAFTKTLASKAPGDVAVFIGHKTDRLPMGIPLVIREQAGGLYTETLIKPGPGGDDLLATAEFLQRHGKALGMSIGYRVHPGGATLERGRDGKTFRKLTSVDLLEFSYAAAQSIANEQALVTGVKAMKYRIEARGDAFAVLDADGEVEGTYPTRAAAEAEMRRLMRDGDEPETPANRGKTVAWDVTDLATLPDSAFLKVDAGEQEGGRTIPSTKRHWAYRDAEGKISVARLEAVLPELTGEPALQGRVQWLLAQPESKLAEADTLEWQRGVAPRLYALGLRLAALAAPVAQKQASMRDVDQDVHDGQVMRPAHCLELAAIMAEAKSLLDTATLINDGAYDRARSARWRQELDLLELAV
jgi:HK97 family phage prohead protease